MRYLWINSTIDYWGPADQIGKWTRMQDEKFNNSLSDSSREGTLSEIERWIHCKQKLGLKPYCFFEEMEIFPDEGDQISFNVFEVYGPHSKYLKQKELFQNIFE
jgi:hypothetical protein